jgi:hypothetical protein
MSSYQLDRPPEHVPPLVELVVFLASTYLSIEAASFPSVAILHGVRRSRYQVADGIAAVF